MKKWTSLFFLILLVMVLSCGDSGGGGSTDDTRNTDDTSDNSDGSALPDLITASLLFDADGDGDLDLIVGSQGSDIAYDILMINDGSGNFSESATTMPTHYLEENGATISFASDDFNQDGNADILAITVDVSDESFYGSSKLQLYLGNGDGTFTDASSQITDNTLNGWPVWTRVADFNQDGSPDFVLTSHNGSYGGRFYLNDGDGNFSPVTVKTYDSGNEYTEDVLTWAGGGDGTDTSTRIPIDVLVGDMDNDGDVDVVATNGYAQGPIVTFLNESTENELVFEIKYFVDQEIGDAYAQIQVRDGALLDINHDGYLDMVASMSISGSDDDAELTPVYAYLNDGAGSFVADDSVFQPEQPGLEHARQWLVDDFNNDGYQDIFIADHGYDYNPYPGHPNLLMLGNAQGQLENVSDTYLENEDSYTHGASTGDVNGDGYSDLFLNNAAGLGDVSERLYFNNNGVGFYASGSGL